MAHTLWLEVKHRGGDGEESGRQQKEEELAASTERGLLRDGDDHQGWDLHHSVDRVVDEVVAWKRRDAGNRVYKGKPASEPKAFVCLFLRIF